MNHAYNLSPEHVLMAYHIGAFPMADCRLGRINWYYADPRAVLPIDPDSFHVPDSLKRRLRSGRFHVTHDLAFKQVIQCCADIHHAKGETWINNQIIEVYHSLHQLGYAHSMEAWRMTPGHERKLVGGLYGVAIGGAFFGESMFHRETDASKVCLVRLVEHLRNRGFILLDTQFINPHLRQFGCFELTHAAYLKQLEKALTLDVTWV